MINAHAYAKQIKGKTVAVFGIGKSNLAVIKALVHEHVTVIAGDDKQDNIDKAVAIGAVGGLMECEWSTLACLVLAPGVPLHFPEPHPVVQKARAAGVEILCDVEILHRLHHHRQTVGITGTNGKSTTTALVGHILECCNVEAEVGGNIGHAVFDLDMPPAEGAFVIEMSSYQIDLCPTFAPDIAVHLNLTPDHLDRHGDMAGYYQAKRNIFRGAGVAIIGIDDEWSAKMARDVAQQGERDVIQISVCEPVERGVYILDGILFDSMFGEAEKIATLNIGSLMGQHNAQNMAAAYAAIRMMGISSDKIIKAMKTFPGLPHRQFMVRRIGDVSYINDSKATNAEAAAKALACYQDVFWIAGGQPKEGGLAGTEIFANRIRNVYLIGAAADDFAVTLEKNNIPFSKCDVLDEAVTRAHHDAQKAGKGTVLLSPACASFDQFKNFEERGDVFTSLVQELRGV